MTRVCETCAAQKADAHFRKFGRGRKKICMDCEDGATTDAAVEAPTPVTIAGPKLEILPGFGFRAGVENDSLAIEQDDAEGKTDNIVLSRTEVKVLFAQYAEWAGLVGAS